MATNQQIYELIQKIKQDQDEMKKTSEQMKETSEQMSRKLYKELGGMNTKLEEVKNEAAIVKDKVEGIEARLKALEIDKEEKKKEESLKRKREEER